MTWNPCVDKDTFSKVGKSTKTIYILYTWIPPILKLFFLSTPTKLCFVDNILQYPRLFSIYCFDKYLALLQKGAQKSFKF